MQRSPLNWQIWLLAAACVWGSLTRDAEAGKIPDNHEPKPDAQVTPPPSPKWGLDKVEAIEVCLPAGEKAYLETLLCADGSVPSSQRLGNAGYRNDPPPDMSQDAQMAAMDANRPLAPGEVDIHIVDIYSLTCPDAEPVQVFLDMYHCPQPTHAAAPTGFKRKQ